MRRRRCRRHGESPRDPWGYGARAEEIFHGTDSQTQDVERMVASMDEVANVAERNAVAIDGVVGVYVSDGTELVSLATKQGRVLLFPADEIKLQLAEMTDHVAHAQADQATSAGRGE